MKLMVYIILSLSILSFADGDNATADTYDYLPVTATVEIDPQLAVTINALIEDADANLFLEGRTAPTMEDPKMVENTIADAMKSGGFCNGKTYFKDTFGDDRVTLSLETVYKKGSLKLVKQFKRQSKYTTGTSKHRTTIVQDEMVWLYEGTIKVDYAIQTDGEERKGVHNQQSKIISPVRLR